MSLPVHSLLSSNWKILDLPACVLYLRVTSGCDLLVRSLRSDDRLLCVLFIWVILFWWIHFLCVLSIWMILILADTLPVCSLCLSDPDLADTLPVCSLYLSDSVYADTLPFFPIFFWSDSVLADTLPVCSLRVIMFSSFLCVWVSDRFFLMLTYFSVSLLSFCPPIVDAVLGDCVHLQWLLVQ